jgi:hypothetical protein
VTRKPDQAVTRDSRRPTSGRADATFPVGQPDEAAREGAPNDNGRRSRVQRCGRKRRRAIPAPAVVAAPLLAPVERVDAAKRRTGSSSRSRRASAARDEHLPQELRGRVEELRPAGDRGAQDVRRRRRQLSPCMRLSSGSPAEYEPILSGLSVKRGRSALEPKRAGRTVGAPSRPLRRAASRPNYAQVGPAPWSCTRRLRCSPSRQTGRSPGPVGMRFQAFAGFRASLVSEASV